MAHGFTTRALAQFTSALQEAHVPSDVEELVSYAFADVLGTALGGRTTQVAQVIGQAAAGAGHDEAAFLLMPGRAPAEAVARVLAVQAHAPDFDDVALQGHPSAVLVPAILAAAQIAPCSGRRMIAAYTAGYEAWNALAQATEKPLHLCGWHPTSSFGTIAAAAAVAKVLDLEAERTAHAFGAAASMTAGLIANFGTMVKPLQVGRAAEAGLYAARLAQAGLEANTAVLEQAGGWIDTVLQQKGGLRPPMTTALSLAERRLDFKLFPVCYCAHRSVVAALSLAERVAAHPSGVARISLRLSPLQDRTLAYRRPET
ncbi:MAG: MmgE/PrpD family protein, partial [Roseovarius sp.]|nr:MmgE/PrpD family protein [Roseovarius sp.]